MNCSPLRRVKALNALLVQFGTNGFADETTTVVLRVMRNSDGSRGEEGNQAVYTYAQDVLAKIGPKVLPALAKEW